MHSQPRLVVSGLAGGSGKTMLSLGLVRAFTTMGMRVKAFKKGPDYIDAAWLGLASQQPPGNLDPFFCSAEQLRSLFIRGTQEADISLIEGNRGLFDGLDLSGSCATSELARILKAPVLLVVDCTKMTRTVAALVRGCTDFEPDLTFAGVILNRTGSSRHESIARQAVETLAGVPVLGALPRSAQPMIHERHMGLAGADELEEVNGRLDQLAAFISRHVDLEAVRQAALQAPVLPCPSPKAAPGDAHRACGSRTHSRPEPLALVAPHNHAPGEHGARAASPGSHALGEQCVFRAAPRGGAARSAPSPRIGYVHDAALWFYYQENLEALRRAGAVLVRLSLLCPEPWPHIDGLYLGGGLPELHAARLAADQSRLLEVRTLARSGIPIYAECGGFMYLASSLTINGERHRMAGVLEEDVVFCSRPQGLGYVEAQVVSPTLFHPPGARIRGHEFHFSRVSSPENAAGRHALRLARGVGMAGVGSDRYDGIVQDALFASYMHIYAPAVPHWAPAFVRACTSQAADGPARYGVFAPDRRQ